MRPRPKRVLPFMPAALLLAGIAYPAMLMATGAPMRSASHWGALSRPCDAIETAEAVFPAGDAGDVTLERSTDALRVVSAVPAEGWDFRIDDGGPDRSVAVVFHKDDARVSFRAAIADCRVRIRVTGEVVAMFTAAPETPAETPGATPAETPGATPAETPAETPAATPAATPAETPAGTPAQAPAPEAQVGMLQAAQAGTVTLQLAGGRLKVLSVAPASGWTHEVKKGGPSRMVRVRFRSDEARVELVARIHEDEVVVWTRSVNVADFGDETTAGTRATPTDPAEVPTTPLAGIPDPLRGHAPAPDGDPAGDTQTFPVGSAPETTTVEVGPAGTVTLKQAGDALELVSVQPAEGWTYAAGRRGPGKVVTVLFLSARGRLFLMADVEGGEIDVDTWPIPFGGDRVGDSGTRDTRLADGDSKDDDRRDDDDRRGDRTRGRDNDR